MQQVFRDLETLRRCGPGMDPVGYQVREKQLVHTVLENVERVCCFLLFFVVFCCCFLLLREKQLSGLLSCFYSFCFFFVFVVFLFLGVSPSFFP